MKDNIKFWCAMGVGKQLTFKEDGSRGEVEVLLPVGQQHVLHNGVLMCGKSREGLKGKTKASRKGVRQKTVQLRIAGVPLCKECEKKYKANSNLSYCKWIEASTQTGLHGVT